MHIYFKSPIATTPQHPLTTEEIQKVFNESHYTIIRAAKTRFSASVSMDVEELMEVEQSATLFFMESLYYFDKATCGPIHDYDTPGRNTPKSLKFYVINYMLGRINFAAQEFRMENLEAITEDELRQELRNVAKRHRPLNSIWSKTLTEKMRQLCPSHEEPLQLLENYQEYLPYLEQDFFGFSSAEEALVSISNTYKLAPKFKQIISDEIFKKGKFYLLRVIPFLQQLNISYDGKIKILPTIDLMPKQHLELFATLLNNFPEVRIIKLLTAEFNDKAVSDLVDSLFKINTILRQKNLQTISSFQDYLKELPTMLISKPKNLGEIHDWLSQIFNNLKLASSKQNLLRQSTELNDLEVAGLRSFVPATEEDLIHVGNAMHICVGSYAEEVQDGESFILILKDKNTYKICIELDVHSLDEGEIKICEIKYQNNVDVPKELVRRIKQELQIHLTKQQNPEEDNHDLALMA